MTGDQFKLGGGLEQGFDLGEIVGAEPPEGLLMSSFSVAGDAQTVAEVFEAGAAVGGPGAGVADHMHTLAFGDPALMLNLLVPIAGEVKSKHIESARTQRAGDMMEMGGGAVFVENVFEGADETVGEVEGCGVFGQGEVFQPVLPKRGAELLFFETLHGVFKHASVEVEAADLMSALGEGGDQTSRAACRFEDAQLVGGRNSAVLGIECFKEGGFLLGVFIKNDVVIKWGVIPVGHNVKIRDRG